jgi:ATP-dependent DNA helicase RecG
LLKYLPGVGPRRAELLGHLNLETIGDLLHHFPRRYEDRRRLRRIRDAVAGEAQVLYGEVASLRERPLRGGRGLLTAKLVEPAEAGARMAIGERSSMDLVWFNQPYLASWIRPGVRLHVYGPVKLHRGKLQMASPEFELESEPAEPEGNAPPPPDASPHIQRIVPVYPLTRGLHQRFLRGVVYRVLQEDLDLGEGPYDLFYPGEPSPLNAYRAVHFPSTWKDLKEARSRFLFEEYFAFASQLVFRREECRHPGGARFTITGELDRKIRSIFPFSFTADQNRAVLEISEDLRGTSPLYRLLQGDVGTGKTAVALYAMLVAIRNGCQCALMAPTEILAQQHHYTISKYLGGHPVRVGLLTGSLRPAERRALLERMAAGREHIVVGTHALVQEGVAFKKLGLVVIDEQHRFGVKERLRLRKKGSDPHVLVMTATPIPRSLCLTAYGDLDYSLLKERPQGRQPVKTILVTARERPRAMEFFRGELSKGRQAYFIYPLIEESETLALPAAIKAHEHLSRQVFPEHQVGLVHGKMSSEEKEEELRRFRSGERLILVATVVVEVGIDVPNASLLFIDDASRFGLAQLHQLRGRVGRGAHPGWCFVGVDSSSKGARERLRVFAATTDGFRISEEDLKLRGPGDYLGVRQSGRPHFLFGNPLEDLPRFLEVKRKTEEFWSDPRSGQYRSTWAWLLGTPSKGETTNEFLGLD